MTANELKALEQSILWKIHRQTQVDFTYIDLREVSGMLPVMFGARDHKIVWSPSVDSLCQTLVDYIRAKGILAIGYFDLTVDILGDSFILPFVRMVKPPYHIRLT